MNAANDERQNLSTTSLSHNTGLVYTAGIKVNHLLHCLPKVIWQPSERGMI